MRIRDWSSDVCSSDLHVEQDDVAEFLLRGEQRQRSADIPGSDQSDLLASHGARHSFVASPALVQRPAGARAKDPLRSQDWRRPTPIPLTKQQRKGRKERKRAV